MMNKGRCWSVLPTDRLSGAPSWQAHASTPELAKGMPHPHFFLTPGRCPTPGHCILPAQQDPCFPFRPSPVHPSPLSQSKVHLGPPRTDPFIWWPVPTSLVSATPLPGHSALIFYLLDSRTGHTQLPATIPCHLTHPTPFSAQLRCHFVWETVLSQGESSRPSLPHQHTSDIPSQQALATWF